MQWAPDSPDPWAERREWSVGVRVLGASIAAVLAIAALIGAYVLARQIDPAGALGLGIERPSSLDKLSLRSGSPNPTSSPSMPPLGVSFPD